MEEALHVHHAVFRGLLPKYGGYESATEGGWARVECGGVAVPRIPVVVIVNNV